MLSHVPSLRYGCLWITLLFISGASCYPPGPIQARLATRGSRVGALQFRQGIVKEKYDNQEKRRISNIMGEIEAILDDKHGLRSSNDSNDVEFDGVLEGDLVINERQAKWMLQAFNTRQKRKLIDNEELRWNISTPIPYLFNPEDFNENEKGIIRWAINHWEQETCIRFKDMGPVVYYTDYILFYKGKGCSSEVGRNGQTQISLNVICISKQIVAHEIGHSLGFWHEQARQDRDDYLDVLWENIQPGKTYNFLTHQTITNDVPYDMSSLMHYLGTDFSKTYPDMLTLKSRDGFLQQVMGGAEKLSFYDAKTANIEYCKDSCRNTKLRRPCEHDSYQDPNDCYSCKCPEGFGGTYCNTAAFSVGGDFAADDRHHMQWR
ncbi:PREDICTED: zinc metalloproteinase nas-30-like isoform X2 [Priapulus caudatus]|uniref:Metalloendopeptidase n=1 Tax=Priapulus caudatus TaxID=37621 RepID=A0ABM1EKP5_PRICU|nr:PREDICTED: zinc metalloproteinase nas-30-like isoform X2 [Priapulus caudatus]